MAAIVLGGCAQIIGIEDLPDNPVSLDDAAPGNDGAPDARTALPDGAVADAALDAGDGIDLTTGLVAYWPLDTIDGEEDERTTPDAVGGFDGQIEGAAAIVPENVNGALSLDGTTAFVRIENAPELNFTGTITIAAWCRPTATDGIRNIVAHGGSSTPNGEVYLRIINGEYQAGSWTGVSYEARALVPAEDVGNWVHLASVFDGTTWRLYRNGIEMATGGNLGTVTVNAEWAIGARARLSDRLFQGEIDEVRIYNRPLSATEVLALTTAQPL